MNNQLRLQVTRSGFLMLILAFFATVFGMIVS